MSNFLVTPSIQEDNNYAFFALNVSLGITKESSYYSVEEAKDAPLVQQMFYLPFVKSVTLTDRGLSIERFDILAWSDVINEVAQEIQNYLNNGGQIAAQSEVKKVPVTVYAESTPNPSVMKFVANKMLVDTIYEFKSVEETTNAPLANKLFNFPFVNEIFIDTNYISINKNEGVEWEEVVMEIREFIRAYIEDGKGVINANQAQSSGFAASTTPIENLDETSQEIIKIIEEYIKPAVASDGGNILFDAYKPEDKSVHVVLQGACSGCPSSTITLKNGIENMLKEMLPGKVATVSAVNG
ncbi:MAG: NifU family protein [Flavobacteriaceae bacterium]|nr:NifU family protein [Flavobacteriaceae bacterium]